MNDHLAAPEFRAELLTLLGRAIPLGPDDLADEELPGAGVPTAALVVVEWQADDGRRWLSCQAMLGSGDLAPRWTAKMLAREGLHWDDADDGADG